MPRCWFVLLRFWLRVDGVLMRLRETRLCCPFAPPAGADPGAPLRTAEAKPSRLQCALGRLTPGCTLQCTTSAFRLMCCCPEEQHALCTY